MSFNAKNAWPNNKASLYRAKRNHKSIPKLCMNKEWIGAVCADLGPYPPGYGEIGDDDKLKEPGIVFSPENELYGDPNKMTLEDILTYEGNGYARTFYDADGVLKRQAHNLYPYSEDRENALDAFGPTNATASENSITVTAAESYDYKQTDAVAASDYVCKAVVTCDTTLSGVGFRMAGIITGTLQTVLVDFVAGEPQELMLSGTIGSTENVQFGLENRAAFHSATTETGYTVTIEKTWVYRSDLPMADNPATGDSYVPTAITPTGADLVADGGFDGDGSAWTTYGTVVFSGGVANVTAGTQVLTQDVGLEDDKQYVCVFDYTEDSSLRLRLENANGILVISEDIVGTGAGTLTLPFSAGSASDITIAADGDLFTGSIDNITVFKYAVDPSQARVLPRVPSYLYDADTAMWNAHNYLTHSEDFTQWEKVSVTVSDSSENPPAGVNSATTLSITDTPHTGFAFVTMSASSELAGGGLWRFVFVAKAGTTDSVSSFLSAAGNHGVRFDLAAVTATPTTPDNEGAITSLGGGWYLCETKFVSPVPPSNNVRIGIENGALEVATYEGTETVHIAGAHLYRSDLNGVVPNSGNPVSGYYVKTTDTPVPATVNSESAYKNAGFYLESEEAINTIPYSADLTQWGKSDNITIDGTLVSRVGGVDIDYVRAQADAYNVDSIYTAWAVISAGTATESRFLVRDNTGTDSTTFSWVGGAPVITDSGSSLDVDVINLGNGQYLVYVVSTIDAASTYLRLEIQPSRGADGSINIYYAQIEEGQFPTSYVPTAGAAETRPPETAQFDDSIVPYPVPTGDGNELVTNGGFDTDLSGWVAGGTWIWDNGAAYHSDTGTGHNLAQDVFEAGKTYKIRWSQAGEFVATYVDGLATLLENNNADGDYERTFTSSVGGNITFRCSDLAYVDNVSVQELNPLAMSFSFKGLVNYAEEDGPATVKFMELLSSGSNYIETRLDTNDSFTGALTALQMASGALSFVQEVNPNTYKPGLNVPMSIATRNTSEAINAAIDGTALTENTSPTEFPPIEGQPLQIGPIFNGHVQEIVVWGYDEGDIGNTGMASASKRDV